jgi:hypothetical protein
MHNQHHIPGQRLLIGIGIFLLVFAVAAIVSWRLMAQDTPPARHDNDQNQAGTLEAKDQNGAAQVKPKPPEANIVIAENALLWEGREFTNWDGVVARLRIMRAAGPVHAHFYLTHGASTLAGNWQFWQHEIMAVYRELFEPAGISFGSISPRASKRYDAIKTADDLAPNPALAHQGKLLDPDGKPASGAQVFILPADRMNGPYLNTGVCLKGTDLRDPFDEQWSPTDAGGEFTIYPTEDDYFIAALHVSGFSLLHVSGKDHQTLPAQLQLERWATVTVSSQKEAIGQTVNFSIIPSGADAQWPDFDIYSIEAADQPVGIKVPAGRVSAQRSLKMEQGTSTSLPLEAFSLQPGERRDLELKPASEEERKHAREIYDQLNQARGK